MLAAWVRETSIYRTQAEYNMMQNVCVWGERASKTDSDYHLYTFGADLPKKSTFFN